MQKYKEAILYIVFIVIGFVYAIVRVKPMIVNLYTIETDLKTKTTESADLDRTLEALKATEMQKNIEISVQTKKIYQPPEAGLDAESSFTVLFDDIIEMTKYNGIKIYSIQYLYNPESDEFVKGAVGKYNVCQLDMQVISDYADLESLLKELYKYPYLININKIELTPYAKNKKILLTNLQLKLYSKKWFKVYTEDSAFVLTAGWTVVCFKINLSTEVFKITAHSTSMVIGQERTNVDAFVG